MADTASTDDPNEISFAKGDILEILDKNGKWWQARKADGSVGSKSTPHALCSHRLLTPPTPLTFSLSQSRHRITSKSSESCCARFALPRPVYVTRSHEHCTPCTYLHPRCVRSCLPFLFCAAPAVVVSYIYPFCSFGSTLLLGPAPAVCSSQYPLRIEYIIILSSAHGALSVSSPAASARPHPTHSRTSRPRTASAAHPENGIVDLRCAGAGVYLCLRYCCYRG